MLKQALVELHARLEFKALQRNLRGIVFYHATNTEPTTKHGLNTTCLQYTLLLSERSKRFEAALDLKKVKVCVVNKNKSHLEVCMFYPYSNLLLMMRYVYCVRSIDIIALRLESGSSFELVHH